MKHRSIAATMALGFAVLFVCPASDPATAQQPTVQRKVLLTQDLPISGYQTVMAAVEIPPGGREGRHTHPGAVVGYVQEGVLTLDHEGKPTATYKAGDVSTSRPARCTKASTRKARPSRSLRPSWSKRANL